MFRPARAWRTDNLLLHRYLRTNSGRGLIVWGLNHGRYIGRGRSGRYMDNIHSIHRTMVGTMVGTMGHWWALHWGKTSPMLRGRQTGHGSTSLADGRPGEFLAISCKIDQDCIYCIRLYSGVLYTCCYLVLPCLTLLPCSQWKQVVHRNINRV